MTRLSTMPTNFRRYVLTVKPKSTSLELAESFQVTSVTINNWLRREGLPIRPRENGVDKKAIEKLLGQGETIPEVCRILKCSDTTVKKVRRGMRCGQ